jgi:hypothetical protein
MLLSTPTPGGATPSRATAVITLGWVCPTWQTNGLRISMLRSGYAEASTDRPASSTEVSHSGIPT